MTQYQMDNISSPEKAQYTWNPKLENLFQSHKKDIRLGLTKFASTGPWNKVVLGQIDQLRPDLPKSTSSKDLLKAYRGLKHEKVLETVNSIPSLNECLDKRNFQMKVNKLPIEQMH